MKSSRANALVPGPFFISLILILLVLALGERSVWSQGSTASISGVVEDASGAAVPGATVTVKSLETGLTRTMTTGEGGNYLALSLPVGQYEIRAEKAGFKAVLRTGIVLVVGQQAVVNLQLTVGEISQAVTVSAEPPLVNTTSASTSGLVGEQQVKDLPLNGRSFDTLIALNPSTASTTSYRSPTSTGGGQGNNFSISGNREDYNIFFMNGIEYTGVSTADVSPGGVSGQLLGVDAVREFNVLENNYGAEYGKRPGGQISVVTMSGTNQFHGTAFEFLRNSALDARNFFDPGSIPPFKRNQFGGSAGAPIRKDRTFLFGNYEGFRQRLGLSGVAIVPDALARQEELPCAVLNAATSTPPIPACVGQSASTYKPVPNASAAMIPYFSLWPTPLPSSPEIFDTKGNPTGAAEVFSHPLQRIREDFGNLRVDQIFSAKDSLSGVYTIDDGDATDPGTQAVIQNPLQQFASVLRAHVFSLQEIHVFSPATLNTARFGFSRAKWHFNGSPAGDFSDLSFVPNQPVGTLSIGSSGLGNFGSFASAGTFGSQQVENVARNLFTYADDVQLTRGKHQVIFGVWIQRVQANDDAADQRNGVASFADLPSLIQGQATQVIATLNPTEIGWRQLAGAWYVQDAIKLLSSLTLSLGVRGEMNNGWNSPAGRASNFVFGPNGILLTQSVIGTSVYQTNNAKNLIGPRVGVAWSPFGNSKTVVHAGFGTYYEQLDYIGSCCDSSPLPPFNDKITVGSAQSPAQFPLQLNPNLSGATVSPSGIDPNLKMPTVEQYTLKVERQITTNTLFSVAYVGEHGYHLLNTVDVNTAIPQIQPDGTQFFPPKAPRANPTLGNSRYTLSNATSSYNALQTDFTKRFSYGVQFRGSYTFSKSLDVHSSSFLGNEGAGGTTTILDPRNPRLDWGPSNFDSTHRFTGNFTYDLPFGRGKPLAENVSGVADKLIGGWEWNGIATIQSGFPFTPLVGFNASGNGDARAPDRVCLGLSPTCNPPQSPGAPLIIGSPNQWFNPAAFGMPCNSVAPIQVQPTCPTITVVTKGNPQTVVPGTYGNAARDILRGPGLGEFDMSIFKITSISERLKLQFRAEFFNLINRANFGMPLTTTFTKSGRVSPSAGLITYTATTSRQIQFGLKLGW